MCSVAIMGWRSFRTMSQIRSRAAKIEIYEPSVAVWVHRDSKFGEFSEEVPAREVKNDVAGANVTVIPNVGWCSDAAGWRLLIGSFLALVRRITGENRNSFAVVTFAAWQSTVRQFLPHHVDCNDARIRKPAMSTYLPHWYLSRFGRIRLRLPIHNGIGSHVVSTALAGVYSPY